MARLSTEKKYSSNIQTLNMSDIPHITNTELFRLLKALPPLDPAGPWVAGGALWRSINNEPLNNCDVDIFFTNKSQYEEGCRKMNSIPFVNNIISETRNKYNTTYKFHVHQGKTFNKTFDVQLIGMDFYESLDRLLDGFDFTVCQFGYDGKNIIAGHTSLDDLTKKRLSVYRIKRPKSMMNHMLKYLNNGFTIPPDQLKYMIREFIMMDIWKKTAGENYDYDNLKKNVYGGEKPGDVVDDEFGGFLDEMEPEIIPESRNWRPLAVRGDIEDNAQGIETHDPQPIAQRPARPPRRRRTTATTSYASVGSVRNYANYANANMGINPFHSTLLPMPAEPPVVQEANPLNPNLGREEGLWFLRPEAFQPIEEPRPNQPVVPMPAVNLNILAEPIVNDPFVENYFANIARRIENGPDLEERDNVS